MNWRSSGTSTWPANFWLQLAVAVGEFRREHVRHGHQLDRAVLARRARSPPRRCRARRSPPAPVEWCCSPPHEHRAGSFRPGWTPRRCGRCRSGSGGVTLRSWCSHSSHVYLMHNLLHLTPERRPARVHSAVPRCRLQVMVLTRRMFVAGAAGAPASPFSAALTECRFT